MSALVIERVCGAAIEPYLGALAALRIAVFRAYPYLYEGTLAYEQRYLLGYARDPRSVIVLARRGKEVLGAATALPLIAYGEGLAALLARAGYAPESLYYFGESVLEAKERGQGIGHRFFDEREAAARGHGYSRACFCAVERSEGHPSRPLDYVPLDAFWQKRGYVRKPEIVTTFAWRDVADGVEARGTTREQNEESDKKMVFWLKELAP